jgi:hypothetical protein
MSTFKVLTASLAIALLVAGCGGNSKTLVSPTSSGTGTGGGGGGTTATEEMGATVGGTFTQGALTTTLPSGSQLSTGGSTSITVQFAVTKTMAPATDAIQITWTSKCPTGTVTFNPATGTNSTGTLTTTYTNNGGCTLSSDTVTAAATSGASNLGSKTTASTAIPLATAVANSIVFITASPTTVGLKGTGQPSTSAVTFEVETAGGGPVAGVTVNFSLSTTIGGLTLVNTTATTGTNGQAVATVQAGTRAATVSVTATAQTPGGQISADSNTLSVSTGIPDASSVSVNATTLNVETLHHFGITVPVTVRLKDRFSNPVPDGTSVIFSASGGGINPASCVTATTSSESGVCTVNWVSQNPVPAHGRVRIIGVVVGEKKFTDNYGVGYFEGPPVPGYPTADPFVDIGDPFRDDNENGQYDVGEVFYDIHASNTYQGPTGKYVGLLCGGASPMTLPTLCTANNSTMYVADQFTLIMSGDAPLPINLAQSGQATPVDATTNPVVNFVVQDENGNAMPAGTTITIQPPSGVTANPQAVTVSDSIDTVNPALSTNPNYYDPTKGGGPLTYSFGLSGPTPAQGKSGPVSLQVKTPNGTTTTLFTGLTVNY